MQLCPKWSSIEVAIEKLPSEDAMEVLIEDTMEDFPEDIEDFHEPSIFDVRQPRFAFGELCGFVDSLSVDF